MNIKEKGQVNRITTNTTATGGTVSAPVHGGATVIHVESDDVRALEKKASDLTNRYIYIGALLKDVLAELERARGEIK